MLRPPRGGARAANSQVVQRGVKEPLVMRIGAGNRHAQRHAAAIGQHRPFHAQLAPIRRVWTGFFPRPREPWWSSHPDIATSIGFLAGRHTAAADTSRACGIDGVAPILEVAVQRTARAEFLGSCLPLAAGSQDVENAFGDFPQIKSRPASQWRGVIPGQERLHASPKPIGNTPTRTRLFSRAQRIGVPPRAESVSRMSLPRPQGQHRQPPPTRADVPAGVIEADDERQQVERQRHHPQKRHHGHVLADVVRGGQQHQRPQRRQGEPAETVPERRRGERGEMREDEGWALQCPVGSGNILIRDLGLGIWRSATRRRGLPRRGRRKGRTPRPTSPTARTNPTPARKGTDSSPAPPESRNSRARRAGRATGRGRPG